MNPIEGLGKKERQRVQELFYPAEVLEATLFCGDGLSAHICFPDGPGLVHPEG